MAARPPQSGVFLGYIDGSASYVLWAFSRGGCDCGGGGGGDVGGKRAAEGAERDEEDLLALIENRVFPAICIWGPQAYVGVFLYLFLLGLYGVFAWLVASSSSTDGAVAGGVIAGGTVLVLCAATLLSMTSYSDPGFIRKGPCPGEYPLLELEDDIISPAAASGVELPELPASAAADMMEPKKDEIDAAREGLAQDSKTTTTATATDLSSAMGADATTKANPSAPPELPLPSQTRRKKLPSSAASSTESSPRRPRRDFTRRVCRRCNIFPPPHAFHCSTCKSCFRGLDHHCPWMGTCVASNNIRFFKSFLWIFALAVLCEVSFIIISSHPSFTVLHFFTCQAPLRHRLTPTNTRRFRFLQTASSPSSSLLPSLGERQRCDLIVIEGLANHKTVHCSFNEITPSSSRTSRSC